MIKVNVKYNNNKVYELVIKGHAGYDVHGKDIVCAAVSSMAITTINNIIALDDSIDYEENSGLLIIRVKRDTEVNNKLLDNLVRMLTELKEQYPKNIEIRNED
ncbi:MAG: ribosomal-processing cysteine protease Prp [Firmicutes bacterium]|nr:ribosomal-processing cysteine protease Prp [Bacillota bacterium]